MSNIRQCPLCFENYDEKDRVPRILPKCLHSMCSRCLPQLYKNPAFVECPTCRQINNVRLDDVPKNRDILEFLEYLKSQAQNQNINAQSSDASQKSSSAEGVQTPPLPYSHFPPSTSSNSLPYTYTNTTPAPPRVPLRTEHTIPSVIADNSRPTNPRYQHQHGEWNETEYLRTLFDDIDHNHDGYIDEVELREALRKGQANSQFDVQTVRILLDKYDRDRNGEISFNEFNALFVGLNEQYNEFLDADADQSGSIEPNELHQMLMRRYQRINNAVPFSASFYEFLFRGIGARVRSTRITFDVYVRLIARLDRLAYDFNQRSPSSHHNKNHHHHHSQHQRGRDFEEFVRDNFFLNF